SRRVGDFETPEQYAQVLRATTDAVRAADSQATVVLGSLYHLHAGQGRRYLEELLEIEGVEEDFDVLGVHCYFEENELSVVDRTLAHAHELLPGKPVWITETSVPSSADSDWVDPQWQADMVVAIHGAFLAGGAERVFWHTLTDPPPRARRKRGTSTHSLYEVRDEGGIRHLKPAGAVYERLLRTLESVDRVGLSALHTESGRALDTSGGRLVYWGVVEVQSGISVHTLADGEVAVTGLVVAAPAWIPRL
ncbi:MAG: glycosyl hydrolase, partial [Myxococcota bacterium]|nr:glycosyl hydrolase [Myxococcota bacterium]